MALIKKGAIDAPALESEEVAVPELGGEVVVRGLTLSQRLELAVQPEGFAQVTRMLSIAVLDAEGEPLFTAGQWEAFGARHYTSAMRLWDVAMRLSGLGEAEREAAEKK